MNPLSGAAQVQISESQSKCEENRLSGKVGESVGVHSDGRFMSLLCKENISQWEMYQHPNII